MVVFYMLMFLYELRLKKDKFKLDAKIIGLLVIIIIIYALIFGLFCFDYAYLQNGYLLFDHSKYYYILTILMAYFSYFIILLSGLILKPFEVIKKKLSKK